LSAVMPCSTSGGPVMRRTPKTRDKTEEGGFECGSTIRRWRPK
jgi:hypothetical protein